MLQQNHAKPDMITRGHQVIPWSHQPQLLKKVGHQSSGGEKRIHQGVNDDPADEVGKRGDGLHQLLILLGLHLAQENGKQRCHGGN